MRPVVMDHIIQILQELREYTKELIESIIDAEQSYFFTNDIDYKELRSGIITEQGDQPGGAGALNPDGTPVKGPPQPNAPPQKPNAQKSFVLELRARIDDYYSIVVRNVRDTIPKQIGYFLVRKSMDKLHQDLYMRIQ